MNSLSLYLLLVLRFQPTDECFRMATSLKHRLRKKTEDKGKVRDKEKETAVSTQVSLTRRSYWTGPRHDRRCQRHQLRNPTDAIIITIGQILY